MGQIKMYIENRDIPLPRCITMVHRLAPRLVSLCPCVASGTSALCYCKAWRIMAWVETPWVSSRIATSTTGWARQPLDGGEKSGKPGFGQIGSFPELVQKLAKRHEATAKTLREIPWCILRLALIWWNGGCCIGKIFQFGCCLLLRGRSPWQPWLGHRKRSWSI